MSRHDPPVARALSELSVAELGALRRLEISAQQEEFAGSFAETVDAWQAAPNDQIIGLGFYQQGEPIGMVLLKRDALAPEWDASGMATLHALKIAAPFQGRGLGTPVLRLAIAKLKRLWPDITELALAVDADNHAALALYRGIGMRDAGPPYKGRVGLEQRLTLELCA